MSLTLDLTAKATGLFLPSDVQAVTFSFEKVFSSLKKSVYLIDVDCYTLAEMQKLNTEQRHLEKPTDVLSFPLFLNQEAWEAFSQPEIALGTIIICPEYAEAQGTPLLDLLHHGILHILGFDHETQEQVWRSVEHAILAEETTQGLAMRGIPD